jgi:hypothetical protein
MERQVFGPLAEAYALLADRRGLQGKKEELGAKHAAYVFKFP